MFLISQLTFSVSLEYVDQVNLNKNRRSEIRGNLFGRHLAELIRVPNDIDKNECTKKHKSEAFIPRFVIACVEEIERRGLLVVGLYRLCGSNDNIKALKSEFDESCTLAIQRLPLVELPVITSLLKQFFQHLPESLVDYSATIALLQAVEIPDESVRCQLIEEILVDLPTPNLETFNYLANHLVTVSNYKAQNKMDLGNLSLIWSYTLFECSPKTIPSTEMNEQTKSGSSLKSNTAEIQAAFSFQQAKVLNCILTSMKSGKLTIPSHSNVIRPQISWYRTVDKQQISSGSTLKDPVRRGPHGVSKYAVRFLPGRPNYAPNMAGVDVNKLRTYQLIVRFVDINDADTQFRCVIELRTTPVDQWPVAYGNIIVKRAPEILPGLTSKIVTEGDSLTLVCRAQGSPPPMISWTRANGRPLSLPGSPQRIYNSTLHIPRVDRYDRGVYRCYAVNNVAGSAEYDVMVEVNYAPHVREARFKGAYGQAPDGNYDMTLECIVNGYPDPDLLWYTGIYDPITNNKPLFDNNRYELEKAQSYGSAGTNNSTLHIPRVDRYDRGVYRCYAVNNVAGSAEYDVMVEVNYAPHVREARFKGAYGQAPDGNYDMTLECIVNGYPDPDLLWYTGIYDPITNNKPLFDNNRYELEKAQSYGSAGTNVTDVFSTLLIRNVRVGDYGNYSCRAENKYGSNFVVLSLFYQSICQGAYCPMLGAVSLEARVNEDGTSVIN
ncbi:uncharacterized protein DC041_0002078 [Schistosoma bovis]|uniref:Uncharacterized protein n=1 Tax=Schistosoma bovis TaxID=6184 RepID=A0A430QLB6_SCHBO|nr:uncharacterized protein DC041_0002078 [Schistosoma bovis]